MHRPFRFSPPSVAPLAVLRPRLLRTLGDRFEHRLITVEAGAGLGKTTLLSQAVAENALSPRGTDHWLTCEPGDSSTSTLLGALLQALGHPPPSGAPTAGDVCAAVWAAAPSEVCLVLDDAHLIEVGSAGEAALRQLLDSLPGNGHLLLAGRRLPQLTRSRLLVQGLALELGEDDLRFDHAEEAALAANHGVDPGPLAAAGGWPALAELSARAGVGRAVRFVWEGCSSRSRTQTAPRSSCWWRSEARVAMLSTPLPALRSGPTGWPRFRSWVRTDTGVSGRTPSGPIWSEATSIPTTSRPRAAASPVPSAPTVTTAPRSSCWPRSESGIRPSRPSSMRATINGFHPGATRWSAGVSCSPRTSPPAPRSSISAP